MISHVQTWGSTRTVEGRQPKEWWWTQPTTIKSGWLCSCLPMQSTLNYTFGIVLKGLEAFKLQAGSRIESTRAEVQVTLPFYLYLLPCRFYWFCQSQLLLYGLDSPRHCQMSELCKLDLQVASAAAVIKVQAQADAHNLYKRESQQAEASLHQAARISLFLYYLYSLYSLYSMYSLYSLYSFVDKKCRNIQCDCKRNWYKTLTAKFTLLCQYTLWPTHQAY